MIWLLVAVGGATGSVLRYGAGRVAISIFGPSTILDTVFVNVTGSFALGLFLILALEKVSVPTEYRGMVAVGLLGGYTTFSTLSFQAVQLVESGELLRAGASLAGNIVLGLAAAYLGMVTARSF